MARRTSTPVTAASDATEAEVDTTTEAPVEATSETTTEASAEAETPAPEADLTDFKAAASDAVEAADESTGDVPVEALATVNKAYRAIDGVKGKNAARAHLDTEMKKAISEDGNIQRAKSFVLIKDGLSAGSSSGSSTRTPADPTQAFVQKVVAIRLALDEVTSNVPEGVSETWTDTANELYTSLADDVTAHRAYLASDDADAEAPEVSPVVRQAFKYAQGRATGGGTSNRPAGAPRRDIGKHIEQVFAELESGAFLTVNEIAKAASAEYGDDRPSAGAVSARLFPKGRDAYSANGITATNEEGQSRGAVKA